MSAVQVRICVETPVTLLRRTPADLDQDVLKVEHLLEECVAHLEILWFTELEYPFTWEIGCTSKWILEYWNIKT